MSRAQASRVLGGGATAMLLAVVAGSTAMLTPAPGSTALASYPPVMSAVMFDGTGGVPAPDHEPVPGVSRDVVVGWIGLAGMAFMSLLGMYQRWRAVRREEAKQDEEAARGSLTVRLADLKEKLAEAEAEAGRLAKQNEQLSDSHDAIHDSLDRVLEENATLRTRVAELEARVAELEVRSDPSPDGEGGVSWA